MFKKILLLIIAIFLTVVPFVSCDDDPDTPLDHVCSHVCPQCGKCKDDSCLDAVCSEKCQCNGHKCQHVCSLCVKCTDANCTDPKCATKCEGHEGYVDYAGQLRLDLSSSSNKIIDAKVRVIGGKTVGYIDGDTTHFSCDTSIVADGVLKVRYLAVNTPESTGKIEQYGKKASNYTKNALMNAQSIVIESEDDKWNADSTGGRYLCWVWYRNSVDEEYRCLNIELLQNGLAIASNSANNKYGTTCVNALNQAKDLKFNCFSGIKDPDYYEGNAISVTLKELRANPTAYVGKDISVEGVIAYGAGQSVYIESYDEETNIYVGMSVYYGFNAAAGLLEMLRIGNKVRIVGSFQYYESGGTYQISGLSYSTRKKGPNYCALISRNNTQSFQSVSVNDFNSGTKSVTYIDTNGDEQTKQLSVSELMMSATVSLSNLTVTHISTTQTGDSKGAMTLTCKDANNNTISVRTDVLHDENNNLVTSDKYSDKNISVKGVVDYYNGYQIKVFAYNAITINN